jgi:hypothetical protein
MLKHIEVQKSTSNKFSAVNQGLVISGNDEFLENLPYDTTQPASGIAYHIHYDRISFGDFLDEDSLDVILVLRLLVD